MAIPKQIFQTFKTKELPWLTRWHIKRMQRKNPEYDYHFYDDDKIEDFFKNEFTEYYKVYKSLTIGAAKADFFRYAILYKKGGVYLDIDCKVVSRFNKFIKETDEAIISIEKNGLLYTQWALIFAPEHPFLKETLEICAENIKEHKYPHNVHETTGPPAFTKGIKRAIEKEPNVKYRKLPVQYKGYLKDKYKLAKFFLYKNRKEHWNQKQLSQDIIKPFED